MMRSILVLGLLSVLLGGGFEVSFSAAPAPRFALIIVANPDPKTWKDRFGIEPSRLSALWYDAKMARDIAEYVFGIDPQRIFVIGLPPDPPCLQFGAANIVSRSATRDVVLQQLQEFAARSATAELAFVYFSGHGGYFPDARRVSDRTEYFVAQEAPVFDFEVASILQSIRAVWLLYVADTCYSKGLARSLSVAQVKSLGVASDEIKRFSSEFWRRLSLPSEPSEKLPPNWVFFSASAQFEPAYEIEVQNTRVSAFTYAFYQTLIHRSPLTPADVKEKVDSLFKQISLSQSAQVSGEALKDRRLPISSVHLPINHIPVLRAGQQFTLLAGRLADVKKGERFRARVGDQAVDFEVESVSLFSASLLPLGSLSSSLPSGVQRIERVIAPRPPKRVRVVVTRKGDPNVEPPVEGEMVIVASPAPDGSYHATVYTPGAQYSFRVNATSEADVCTQLESYAANMEQSHTAADMLAYVGNPSDSTLSLTTDRGNNYPHYTIGDDFRIFISSSRGGYLLLLGVESSGAFSVLYPNKELPQVYLVPNQQLTLPLRATAPAGITRVVALLYDRPITLPTDLLIQPAPGFVHYTVAPQNARAFSERVRSHISLARSRDLGVPVVNTQSVASAEIWVVVQEPPRAPRSRK
ncbi:MAG: DUF4384 domain-containing protein [Fimbriimonadales bacterium]|nr:DUF4384 domain-containing protein [Fimbriimonadales bacterium]